MSSVKQINCDPNLNYDLTTEGGLFKSCSSEQKEKILLKALSSPDPDQRYAAAKRLIEQGYYSSSCLNKILKIFPQEKDPQGIAMLIEFFVSYGIKEAVPLLVEKRKQDPQNYSILFGLTKLGDLATLRQLFAEVPSKTVALALLEQGDPFPYLNHFAQKDYELFGEPDNYLVYDVPYWELLWGIGETFSSHREATFAAQQRPEAEKSLSKMLDLLSQKKEAVRNNKGLVSFLLSMINFLSSCQNVPQGESIKKLLEKSALVFNDIATPECLPEILSFVKKHPFPLTLKMVANYLQKHFSRFTDDQKKSIIALAKELMKTDLYEKYAIEILTIMEDQDLIPYLTSKIKENNFCPQEIFALARLDFSTETEELFLKVLKDEKNYARDSRIAAAMVLALKGNREGLDLLLETLYFELATSPLTPTPENLARKQYRIELLLRNLMKIIEPQDRDHKYLKALLNSDELFIRSLGEEIVKIIESRKLSPTNY